VEDARIDLERALAVDPRNVGAWTGLGLVHVRRRAFDDAITALDAALAIDSADAQTRVWRAEALSFLGRLDEGIVEIDRAIALQPDLVDAWYDKSLMLLRRDPDRVDDARIPLEKVISLAKTGAKAVNARRNLCALHVMKGRPLEARRELDAVMKAYGRPEDAALLAGFVLEAEGKIPLAILALGKGLAARGDVAEYLFLRGRLRLDTGDDAGGLNDLRRALDLPLAVRVETETGAMLHFYGRHLLNGCVTSIDTRMAANPPARLARRLDTILDRLDALLR